MCIAIAQTSLAEILLRLNTGLVSIIHAFLQHSRDKNAQQHQQIDYHSLTDLSDRSRIDTCRALGLGSARLQANAVRATPAGQSPTL